jgi:uncharacterized glyoxalase superfamily protein PhnB
VAFRVFTEEMDLWHVRTPISYYDSARAIGIRCEPGVDGRILEVYEDGSFEIARITIWEPGRRVAWSSSHDDVEVEISFDPAESGTAVLVRATVPDGGADRGGTSIVRIVPRWLPVWVARREHVPHDIVDLPRLNLQLHYARPVEAMHWLGDAFGLPLPSDLPAEDREAPNWIETRIGGAAVMLFRRQESADTTPMAVPFVYVDDLDAHFDRAVAHGATVVEPIHEYGYRIYVCDDPEGQRWTFAQARPTMRDGGVVNGVSLGAP